AEELRRERSFVLAAAGRNGHVLKYVEEALQDEEVVQQAIEQCGSALSDVLGDAFEESSRQKKIKHVLLDKGVLGSDLKPSRQMELEQIPNICFFGLDTDTSSAPGARGVQRALGPAGAGLLEMAALGLPVPRGFCLTDGAQWGEAKMALRQLEALHQHTSRGPLLLSLRNGQTEISNLGLTDEIALQLATENANCAWDSYRRLVVSYAKTVHRLSAEPFDAELSKLKDQLATKDHLGGRLEDWQLPTRELEKLVETYKLIFEDQTGEAFPQDPEVQFKKSLAALEGTVIVESMVFGNYDFDSGVGVLQLQEPGLNGAWLPKAQREDLPERPRRSLSKQHSQDWAKANAISESVRETEFLSLEEKFLPVCAGLAHCKDVLLKAHLQVDAVHFAVQQGRLWLLGPAPTSPASASTASGGSECSLLEEPEELPEPIPPEPELELPELFEESELPETAPEPLPAAATELPELVTRRDGFRSFG
ncbi:Pyruvate, partial [Durusdinium trenchii]